MTVRSSLAAGAPALLMLLGADCGETPVPPPLGPDRTPPVACLNLYVLKRTSSCPDQIRLAADPRCSTDDRSGPDALTVRWDYDDDGTWDTGFLPLVLNSDYIPLRVSDLWTARCEVRDEAGNTAEAVAALDVEATGLVPGYPDIAAGVLELPDTVEVGEPFDVLLWENCWVDRPGPNYKTEILLDGSLWVEQWGSCGPAIAYCSGHGRIGLSISSRGTHEITVILEAEDILAETDETNNTATGTVVVVAPTATSPARSPSPGTR